MKQRTICREVSIRGKALHTGQDVTLTFHPAPAQSGLAFQRLDLPGQPIIKPDIALVTDVVRNTTVTSGEVTLQTIEHVLSALHGCGVDNVVVALDASEPPILDGSAQGFVRLLEEAGFAEQEAERSYLTLDEPISVSRGESSLVALPYDGLRITCTSTDDCGTHTQHVSVEVDPASYAAELAPARTFALAEDVEELRKLGKIQGGTLESAILLQAGVPIAREQLRFPEELARHKALDLLGDLALLGQPLRAHLIAVRTGHALNAELCRAIRARLAQRQTSMRRPPQVQPHEKALDVRRVLDVLPHRYPFLLIDRVIAMPSDKELVAIKNVTINEPYFQGHFPGAPVMPGVLQIEVMAQAAGLLMLRQVSSQGKIAFLMSCDKVRFRKAVVPGDQIVVQAKLTRSRGMKIGVAEAECRVQDKVVSSAELMFMIVDAQDEV